MIPDEKIKLDAVEIDNEVFYRISNVDAMRPFFMSVVSDSNHWMFISSNGGLTAGRKNSEYALFPYYTDDKISESIETTGSKTIFRIHKNNEIFTWEPFSVRNEGKYKCIRNLYKNRFGNKIIFEEINIDLSLCYRYQWNSSNLFGFVKRGKLLNQGETAIEVHILDGLQNIVPYGVGSDLQNKTSNLADAYKRTELVNESGIGIFALSAIIVDKAEPSEALKANVAWSAGLDNTTYLLSSLQLDHFRKNGTVKQEEDIKGEKGAFFIVSKTTLKAGEEKEWMLVANVNQNQAAITVLSEEIKNNKDLVQKVLGDIESGTDDLKKLTYAADGLQSTADDLKDTRHYSNVLFNIMRGGIFDDNYQVEKWDFSSYLQKANRKVFEEIRDIMYDLPEKFSVFQLQSVIEKSGNLNFIRLAIEYLPIKFSRRHGDPSRPWNQFSINTKSETDGSKILDYQGNWRDIFQNWEALALSYPEFTEGMIFKFLNASTFDGYNPYRVTKDGFDWETIEPDNPWSYIGYWGDHQIIYLLKFLEFIEHCEPDVLRGLLNKNGFVYANVPYKIKSYTEILKNPKSTIEFDERNDHSIRKRIQMFGADGALLTNQQDDICQVSFTEKILATVLAKLSNFIPGGGIWMNTQRPEWNDANNALVGNGVSMVTLYYLRRFLKFFQPVFQNNSSKQFTLTTEIHSFFNAVAETFSQNRNMLTGGIDDNSRKKMTDALGTAGSNFRALVYENKFSGKKDMLASTQLDLFIHNALEFIEHTIKSNRRTDGLYHAYNLISYDNQAAKISHLSEMLEGQVAVLSSGFLSAKESLEVLDALKKSALFRDDQYSYLLYPNKELPRFLQKNNLPENALQQSALLKILVETGDTSIVEQDINGYLHFNGNFRNAHDLEPALNSLKQEYQSLVQKEKEIILDLFEQVFNHKEFTGRSGTFFGYEGLGSIYWHMVSKLLLAVQETCISAIDQNTNKEITGCLLAHFYEINEGIGVHKPPQLYGAFPSDPYSHTPLNKGAQQPGMTGQVKEDILSRFGELGVSVKAGKLNFKPVMLRKNEFLTHSKKITAVDIFSNEQIIQLEKGSLCFTWCQVPVIYILDKRDRLEILYCDGKITTFDALDVDEATSKKIFNRTGDVIQVTVFLNEENLL